MKEKERRCYHRLILLNSIRSLEEECSVALRAGVFVLVPDGMTKTEILCPALVLKQTYINPNTSRQQLNKNYQDQTLNHKGVGRGGVAVRRGAKIKKKNR